MSVCASPPHNINLNTLSIVPILFACNRLPNRYYVIFSWALTHRLVFMRIGGDSHGWTMLHAMGSSVAVLHWFDSVAINENIAPLPRGFVDMDRPEGSTSTSQHRTCYVYCAVEWDRFTCVALATELCTSNWWQRCAAVWALLANGTRSGVSVAHILENACEIVFGVVPWRLSIKIGKHGVYMASVLVQRQIHSKYIQLILFVFSMLSPTLGHRDLASNRAKHFMK